MNKKILIASIFATLILMLSMTSVVGVSDVEDECDYPYIEFFAICLISGYYKTKTSNDDYKLILDSGYDNETMNVQGITFYYYAAKVPSLDRDNVQVWKIEAVRFLGISLNGFVFGIGTGVRVEPMPYAPS